MFHSTPSKSLRKSFSFNFFLMFVLDHIFLLCIMKIHSKTYPNAQFKGYNVYMHISITGELWRRQPSFPSKIDRSTESFADLIYTGLLIMIGPELYFPMAHKLLWKKKNYLCMEKKWGKWKQPCRGIYGDRLISQVLCFVGVSLIVFLAYWRP